MNTVLDLPCSDTQALDLFLTEEPNAPVVVCIHGGGFHCSSRKDARCVQIATYLTGVGFHCASISYTLAPLADRFSRWPLNSCDVADAIAFLHAHAGEYGMDAQRLGLIGFSAGSTLAGLYAFGGAAFYRWAGYETSVFPVGALAGFYGPYDFRRRLPERRSEDPDTNIHLSPAHWLHRAERELIPPIWQVHGDQDAIVDIAQHRYFKEEAEALGLDFSSVMAPGFPHSFAAQDQRPTGETIDLRPDLATFFSTHL